MIRHYLILFCISCIIPKVFGQLAKTRVADGSMLIQAQIQSVSISDKQALFEPHRKHGPYLSLGFELQQFEYQFLGLRQRLNFDLASESLYILALIVIKNDWKIADPDGRFRTTSYFNTGLFEYVPILPLYTNHFMSLGAGGALYDLNYTHYLYDEEGEPVNPNKSAVSQYGFYGGWSLFADFLLTSKLTLHNDFYHGYNFFNGAQGRLRKLDEPTNGFRSWKITSTLMHESGLFLSIRYHQFVNRTSIATDASRFTIGLGYRFGND